MLKEEQKTIEAFSQQFSAQRKAHFSKSSLKNKKHRKLPGFSPVFLDAYFKGLTLHICRVLIIQIKEKQSCFSKTLGEQNGNEKF